MSKRVTCPICGTRQQINQNSMCIRKHRIGARNSEVCKGSGMIIFSPAVFEQKEATQYTLIYKDTPVFTSEKLQLVQEIELHCRDQARIVELTREQIQETLDIDEAQLGRTNVFWSFIPEWITETASELWSNLPLYRSSTSPDLAAIPAASPRWQAAFSDALKKTRQACEKSEALSTELERAIDVCVGARYVLPRIPEPSPNIIYAIIESAHRISSPLDKPFPFSALWSLFTIGKVKDGDEEQLLAAISSAPSVLLECARSYDLRYDLMQIEKLSDEIKARALLDK